LDAEPASGSPAEDDRLLLLCAGGDRQAFATLVRRHSAKAHGLALRLTGNHADAEEVAQEAFWRVWSGAGKWQPGGARFSTFLHRIVVNLCIDRERRRKIRRLVQLDPEMDPVDTAVPADVVGEQRAELVQVLAAIEHLPTRQRAALLLAAEGEQSNRDIALALGTTEKSVESMLVRARRTLRAGLARNGGGDAGTR
jgi:RNA polymerase sigma-70 factor, ECF subfamily